MTERLQDRFAECGTGVVIEPDVWIEHPELFRVGDRVRLGRGFSSQGSTEVIIGPDSSFYPNCFLQGSGRLELAAEVDFYPGGYLSVGGPGGLISVGRKSHFAAGCAVYGGGGVRLGAYCNVAAHVVITSVQHDPARHDVPMALAPSTSAPITIADDVWLGANATVVQGVTIATGCILGANGVLTRDTEPYGIYAGVPARRIADRRPAS
ncbi:acyltransferase [Microlunatus parietis]|uniref:Acetyltransferase-like isoleucine patch superfamily enzyme n=1 Tax=Microlunatus parietis TaxID=682979 RepID=A0A7Y9ICW1_9ACTN|nr:acyltransferase [Microlunatus parietis]NYE74469.1 acetyltransferase-like isoleucine patch superfamily enzyme [Microlunatus parietis]